MTRSMLMLAAAGSVAATSSGQIELYRTFSDDIADFSGDSSGNNALYIGNIAFAVEYDGTNVYLAGFNGGTSPWVQIGYIVDALAGGPNRAGLFDGTDPLNPVQDPAVSSRRVHPASRGYQSLDWMPGAGLLANSDRGSAEIGAAIAYDTETQLTPFPIGSNATSFRGLGAVAWDPGPDGNGYDTNGDGLSDGPVASLLLQPLDTVGPLGVRLPDMQTGLGQAVYAANPVAPELQGPIVEFAPGTTDRDGLGGTFYRGFDFSPDGQWVIAVGDGDLVIAQRDLMNNVTSRIVVESSPGNPGDAPFVVGQQCTFLDNFNGQDLIVVNQRLSTAPDQALTSVVKFFDTAGNAVSYSLFDESSSPLTLPNQSGVYDFAWDEPSQTLVLLDANGRFVHFFSPTASAGDRLCADQNDDGQVLPNDFNAWILNFNNGDIRSDTNQDGLITPADFNGWILAYNAGQNGPICNP